MIEADVVVPVVMREHYRTYRVTLADAPTAGAAMTHPHTWHMDVTGHPRFIDNDLVFYKGHQPIAGFGRGQWLRMEILEEDE